MTGEPIVIEGTLSAGSGVVDYWTPGTRLELIGAILDRAGSADVPIFPADRQLIYFLIHGSSDFLEANRLNYKAVIEAPRIQEGEQQ